MPWEFTDHTQLGQRPPLHPFPSLSAYPKASPCSRAEPVTPVTAFLNAPLSPIQ